MSDHMALSFAKRLSRRCRRDGGACLAPKCGFLHDKLATASPVQQPGVRNRRRQKLTRKLLATFNQLSICRSTVESC
jgi:hypothetical protein